MALKRAGQLTAKDLAGELGLSLNAIRHHLKELEAEGVVQYRRQQRGIGAPAFAYHLTPAGEALFPHHYAELLNDMLDQLARDFGREGAVEALRGRYRALTHRLQHDLGGASPGERISTVLRLLGDQGYMPEMRAGAAATAAVNDFALLKHNCPILAVAERYPEVCAAEIQFLREVLMADVTRGDHIASGCNACEYSIRFPAGSAPASKENT